MADGQPRGYLHPHLCAGFKSNLCTAIQLPANAPGKQQKMAQPLGFLTPMWEAWMGPWPLVLAWPSLAVRNI